MAELHLSTFPEPVIRDGFAHLTPKLFRHLDRQAKSNAGVPIRILAHDNKHLNGSFALCEGFAIGVKRHIFDEQIAEIGMITLSNKVNIDIFAQCKRPEMDRSKIQPNLIYPFIVAHELTHKKYGDTVAMIFAHQEFGRDLLPAIEMRADREAWAAIYPGMPLPRNKETKRRIKHLESILDRLYDYMNGNHWNGRGPYQRKPLSTARGTWVPMDHIKYGIPWSHSAKSPSQAVA